MLGVSRELAYSLWREQQPPKKSRARLAGGGGGAPVFFMGHSWRRGKKYVVVINGHPIHFGDATMQDFTKHHDVARRRNYLSRHASRENWTRTGVLTPGFWSRWVLWNKPSKRASIKYIEDSLNVKIKPL